MIWFGCVLWHIKHCGLFNAKSSSYLMKNDNEGYSLDKRNLSIYLSIYL